MIAPPSGHRPLQARRRSAARLAAVQALYQLELGGGPVEAVITEFVRHRLGREIEGANYGDADAELFAELARGVVARRDELDRLLRSVLMPEWPLERLETVLRAILRAAAYELVARTDVPARVVISEYVDIANAFFEGKEIGFANGVLDRLAHSLRPQELAQRA